MKRIVITITALLLCLTMLAQSSPVISDQGRKHFKAGEAFLAVAVNSEQYLLAAEEFEQVTKTDPSFSDTYFNLGKIYTRVGKEKGVAYFKKAEDCFTKYLALNPGDSAIVDDELYVLNSFRKQFASDSKMDSNVEFLVYRDTTIIINNEEYSLVLNGPVDLGISVQWAACNVGANEPNEMGKVFAWGETTMKSRYGRFWGKDNNYKFNAGHRLYSKYNEYSAMGDVDGLYRLQPHDDAATQNMGNSWRMPTLDEIDELLNENNNLFGLYEFRGKSGILVYSPKTKKALFLPTTGTYGGTDYRSGYDIYGYYWTSILWEDNSGCAVCLGFKCFGYLEGEDEYYASVWREPHAREAGLAVRAVLKPKGEQ